MTNIEIPEEIKANAQRVLDGRENFISSTVQMAEYILSLGKPEFEAEPFVIYSVLVGKEATPRVGFRVKKNVPYPWVVLNIDSTDKNKAYPESAYNEIHRDKDIKVIERWTPDAPELEFGIGDPEDAVDLGRKVLIRGTIGSTYVDDDGDVRVEMTFAGGIDASHHVSAKDVAYADGGR